MKKLLLKNTFFVSLGLLSLTVFTGCDKNDTDTPTAEYTNGVFVLNEGNYGKGNADNSFINKNKNTVENNIFNKVNKRPAGDVIQSMFVLQDRGYIVANNSNKVEIVNIKSFQTLGVISNLKQPRYFTAQDHAKGYVTEWGITTDNSGTVSVIDLHSNAVTKTITVGKQPEQLLLHNNKLYVANYGETYLTVIDVATETVESTIQVGDGPKEFTMDAAGNIWVLCGGFYQPDFSTTPGSLVKFNPANPLGKTTFPLTSTFSQPEDLTLDGTKNKLYYSYAGGVYEMPVNATAVPSTPIINRYCYGIGVDPADNTIYGADAGNFSSNGQVIRYNTSGTAIDSFQVGVAPNGFIFR